MKTVIKLIILFCGLSQFASAQNELQLLQEFEAPFPYRVFFANIDHDTPKLIVNRDNGFDLYNLDYTLYTSVQFPLAIDTIGTKLLFLVTRSLFDCDTNNVEYLISGSVGQNLFVKIYREDGTEIFSLDGYGFTNIGYNSQDPTLHYVVSDASGSYIMLSDNWSSYHLYHMCGQVPQLSARNLDGVVLKTSGVITEQNGFGIYPNPGKDHIRLDYDLQGHSYANVSILNASGQVMKEVKIGNAFDFIQLNISDLAQGTYIARISSDDGFQLAEKFVKVE